eukprot:CAMPEP_0117658296 /NCGR_PEP_ID=MMETSP0804-20121206/5789_1 /TAXON_ID=1074897 /ORGANISM="Tetraselmis astigmatica, Strain CCMP880" /LENGTH=541 /DNA_ID=CAMNT_0005464809 /DNA_START=324 /DNA_END=1950 /DNA_ORIENTATION=-
MAYASWRWLDYACIVLFALLTVFIGKFFAGRNQSTDSYFMGNRSLPGWAVGFSMLSTLMSSITFLAYPATTIMGDWRLYPKDFMVPLAQLLAVLFIAPKFREKPGRVSAYEVLEERFNVGLRLYGAATYILAQVLKLGTVLYLVSIPAGVIIGSSSQVIIILSGGFVAIYSCAGGISAVVYTDVVQGIVLLAGGVSVIVVVMTTTPGGLGGIISAGREEHKFFLGEWRMDWEHKTLPTVLVYGMTSFLGHTMSYQHTVQRYLLVPNTKELWRALGLSAALSVPTWGMFYFVGSCVWSYYRSHPDAQVQAMLDTMKADDVFPHFILTVLPPGVSGLVISGVFAAAMSTMDSSLNAVSSVVVTDIVKRLMFPNLKDTQYLLMGRVVSVCTAALMIAMALLLAGLQKESMNERLQSVLGGPVIGLFSCALFMPRVGAETALAGVAVATMANFYFVGARYRWFPADPWSALLHSYWVSFWVNVTFMAAVLVAEAALALHRWWASELAFRYTKAKDSDAAEDTGVGIARHGDVELMSTTALEGHSG